MAPEAKKWVKPARRKRRKGADFYVDGINCDDAILTMPSVKKLGIKEIKDLPTGYFDKLRYTRHVMAPGKIVLTLRFIEDIKED